MNQASKSVIRGKYLERRIQQQQMEIGQMVANAIREYHTRFVEPRYRRIEWMLFPLRLWDLAWFSWRWGKTWAKARLVRKVK